MKERYENTERSKIKVVYSLLPVSEVYFLPKCEVAVCHRPHIFCANPETISLSYRFLSPLLITTLGLEH
jgi:hypothetical protein